MNKTAGCFLSETSERKQPAILSWPYLARCRKRGSPSWRPRSVELTAQSEPFDDRLVALDFHGPHIVQQAAALRDELQETAPGMVVLGMGLEVFCQVGDALRKNGYLDFR